MTTPTPPRSVDTLESRIAASLQLEADVRRLALRRAYAHQPEPFEAEFADLAIHPTRHLATDNDYPAWAAAMAANQTTPKEARS